MPSAISHPYYGIICHYPSILYAVWSSSNPILKPIYLLRVNMSVCHLTVPQIKPLCSTTVHIINACMYVCMYVCKTLI